MKTRKIGELCELRYGKSLPKAKRSGGSVPVFGSNGIVGYHSESLLEQETVVVGRKGSVGKLHYVTGASWPIDTTYYVHLLEDVYLPWLYRIMGILNLDSLNRHAAVPGLNRDDVYRIPILVPEKDEQVRIANLLSKVEGLIATRKKSIEQLDELLKSVFLDMFGYPVKNEKGWDVKPLREIATIQRGRFSPRPRNDPKYYDGEYPFIQTGDIARSKGRLSEYTQTLNEFGIKVSKQFKMGTIVIAIVGATIGETAILNIDSYAPDSVIGIIPKTKEYSDSVFIEFVLRFWKPIIKSKAPEAARANINLDTLRPLSIIYPDTELLGKFASTVCKAEFVIKKMQESLADLLQFYNSLCQKAFSGKLDLSSISIPDTNSQYITRESDARHHEEQQESGLFDNNAPRHLKDLMARLQDFNKNAIEMKTALERRLPLSLQPKQQDVITETITQFANLSSPSEELKQMPIISETMQKMAHPGTKVVPPSGLHSRTENRLAFLTLFRFQHHSKAEI